MARLSRCEHASIALAPMAARSGSKRSLNVRACGTRYVRQAVHASVPGQKRTSNERFDPRPVFFPVRIRKDYGGENVSWLRRLAVTLIKHNDTLKASIRQKRLRAGYDFEFLLEILNSVPVAD
ncbi:hypothetical protein Poly21_35940 [Allorhodopirellula heiligendammensis]|uniref:Transposase n=1 Tax=Allorhodopirellula heiligendammensis TaxID=2714739 RepID=A0A5C6C0I8_9BACT|nr:hypothetical protein Poly21_35940 [Allorhodopirellula heiligendammensis]